MTAMTTLRDVPPAASAIGLDVRIFKASTSREIGVAFEILARERPDALLVDIDPFLTSRRVQLVTLAARHAIPAAYAVREFAEIGGLMSYGASLTDAYRQLGIYTAAPFGHAWPGGRCPLLRAKQKSRTWATTSVFDPERSRIGLPTTDRLRGPDTC